MIALKLGRAVSGRASALWIVKLAVLAVIVGAAVFTPGFMTPASAIATLDHAALIGLVGLGMTFITISGNQLSLSLGATLSAAALAFIAASGLGTVGACAVAIATGVALQAAQGFVIGYFGANPIIVSIAGLGLILGIGTHITGGGEVYPAAAASLAPLQSRLGPFNMLIVVFAVGSAAAELLLSRTRFGRQLIAVGSSSRAAIASGIQVPMVVTATYAVAGFFCALAGMLAAARFRYASLEIGVGYDYDAFGSVLIGGTLLRGGFGSAWRTVLGALVLASVHTILVLRGYSQEAQYVLLGVFVLGAVCLSSREER
jgi:ribose/xylose/arabinose/galactoside ABC-type transport system permease subunit